MPLLSIVAVSALATSGLMLVVGHGGVQLAAHLAFALGVLPLILGAMAYFIPVLTRGAAATGGAWMPAPTASLAGTIAVLGFASSFDAALLVAAAILGIAAASGLLAWATLRVRAMVGRRHPGLDWYVAALGFLVLALCCVPLMVAFPATREPLRQFHLHANLLGFVGITAVGTLQVLLPTTMGQADPDALQRLRRDLRWAVTGSLLIAGGGAAVAAGSSWGRIAALVGTLAWLLVMTRMLLGWWHRFGAAMLASQGAAASLLLASVGFCGLLFAGILHDYGILSGRAAIAAYVVGFLLPLVSGAAAYLMPVWIRPGAQGEWHRGLRARLCRGSGWRATALLVAGVLLVLG